MMKLAVILTIISVVALTAANSGPPHGKIVSCAVSVQSPQIGTGPQFKIENVDLNLCTHLIYIDRSALIGEDPWDSKDISNQLWRTNEYKEITDLRTKYPHLKVSLLIDHLQPNFYAMTTRPRSRQRYIKNAINYRLEHKFNGLDMNWRDLGNELDESFVLLLKDMHEEFKKHNLMLTASFSAEKEILAQDHYYVKMSEYLNFMHFTLLFASEKGLPNQVINQHGISAFKFLITTLIGLGVPSKKIIVGLKFGGLDINVVSRYALTDLGYDQICNELSNDEAKRWYKHFDDNEGLAIAKQMDEEIPFFHRIFIFENTRSIANRMRIVVEMDLGGAMAVLINSDDFNGICGMDKDTYEDFNMTENLMNFQLQNNSKFPLLQTINDAIAVASDKMFQEAQFEMQ